MSTELKIFATDDTTWYAAEDAEHAATLYLQDTGDPCEDGYPRELTDDELDAKVPEVDEDELPTGEMTTPREWLKSASPGFIASSESW